MTTSLVDLWHGAQDAALEHDAQIMRVGSKRGFLICSSSQHHLDGVWPLLQMSEPRLERRSCRGYGYAFPLNLWPPMIQLVAQLDKVLKMRHEVEVDENYFGNFNGLFYLRALVGKQRRLENVPFTHNGWERAKIGRIEEVQITQLPGARRLDVWTKNFLRPKSPLPELLSTQKRDILPTLDWARRDRTEDLLSRLEGKPLEQVLGNYSGRESERRTDPFDKNAR